MTQGGGSSAGVSGIAGNSGSGRRQQVRQWFKALAMVRVGLVVAQVAGEGKDMK